MGEWAFELEVKVRIKASGEEGVVIGRTQYLEVSNQYLIRYKGGDGRAVENWWSESALEAAS